MEYGSIAFLNVCKTRINRFQIVQNDAIRAILKIPKYIRIQTLHDAASIPTISDRLVSLSQKHLASMEQSYPLLKTLYLKKGINQKNELSHISPLDILKPNICITMDFNGKIIAQWKSSHVQKGAAQVVEPAPREEAKMGAAPPPY
jgi:hypothetical protein